MTMGDPSGVGPELCIRLLERLKKNSPPLLIIGDYQILKAALEKFGAKNARAWFSSGQIFSRLPPEQPAARLAILDLSRLDPKKIFARRGSKEHGLASWKYIEAAVKLCQSKTCSGIVTLPVNKDAMMKAGCPFPGHTDLLASLDNTDHAVMLMVLGNLRVALLTHHIPLRDVPKQIETRKILPILKLMNQSLKIDFGIPSPKIGVLGLNPHAGEAGKIGDEEIRRIRPAIASARKLGINASGPHPADTVFHRALNHEFDALLAMYHDQGIGPLKTLDFERVVNITLGLSFVRTSPGHGTAYDIAWRGRASEQSLLQAFELAGRLVQNRKRNNG